jgi:hypothetical protein
MKRVISQLFIIIFIISSGQGVSPQLLVRNNSFLQSSGTQGTTTVITIDGDPSDWAGITPFLVDPQGDSLAGLDTDIVGVYSYEDTTYEYLMVRAASNIRKDVNNVNIEINFDLRPGKSICWHQDELTSGIQPPNKYFFFTHSACDVITPFPIDPGDITMAWGSVLEVRILKSALEPIIFFRPIFAAFWTNLDSVWTNVDMVSIPQVSGNIKDSGNNPISDVTLSTGTGYSDTTSVDGSYSIGLPAGNYTITPAKNGFSFSPPSRSVSVTQGVGGVNFIAKKNVVTFLPIIIK